MKFAIFTIAILALAAGTSAYNADLNADMVDRMAELSEKSDYVGLVISSIQLHLETGGPIEVIVRLLDEIDAELVKEQKAHRAYRDAQERAWKFTKRRLDAEITKWTNEVNRLTAAINKNTAARNKAIKLRRARQADLAKNRQTQRQKTKERVKEHKEFLKNQAEHIEAIKSMKEVMPEIRKLLKDWRKNVPKGNAPGMPKLMANPKGVSLVQVQSVQKKISMIHKLLSRSAHSEWVPLVAVLAEVAVNAEYFADKSKVNRIIGMLSNIDLRIKASLSKLRSDEAEAKRQYIITMGNLKKEEALLVKRIGQLTKKINRLAKKIASLKRQRTFAKKKVASAKSELKKAKAFWQNVQKVYILETKKRAHDRKIVAECKKLFVGLKNPTFHAKAKK